MKATDIYREYREFHYKDQEANRMTPGRTMATPERLRKFIEMNKSRIKLDQALRFAGVADAYRHPTNLRGVEELQNIILEIYS